MNLSALDYVLWAANFIGVAAILFILISRRRWREFPVFTALNGSYMAAGVLLFAVNLGRSLFWYERVYYTTDFINLILWLGVVWEIARIVLRPTGSWVRDARKQFLLWSASGLALAVALPFLIVRPDSDLLRVWDTRFGLFDSVLLVELVTVLQLTSNRLGLSWRNHVMALASALGGLSAVTIVINGLHGLLGVHRVYIALEQAAQALYPIIYVYLIVQFWREEPARRPISPELRAYILALHERVKNDLDTVNAQR